MVSIADHSFSFEDECPCPRHRFLEDAGQQDGERWEIIYMCFVLLYMFIALLSDRIGADAVMLTALTLCMAANIISIPEGIQGFSNQGLITVMVRIRALPPILCTSLKRASSLCVSSV